MIPLKSSNRSAGWTLNGSASYFTICTEYYRNIEVASSDREDFVAACIKTVARLNETDP